MHYSACKVYILVQKLSRISVFLVRFERTQIELESVLQAASEYLIRFQNGQPVAEKILFLCFSIFVVQ